MRTIPTRRTQPIQISAMVRPAFHLNAIFLRDKAWCLFISCRPRARRRCSSINWSRRPGHWSPPSWLNPTSGIRFWRQLPMWRQEFPNNLMRILHVEDDDTSHKEIRCRKKAGWRRLLNFFYLSLDRPILHPRCETANKSL